MLMHRASSKKQDKFYNGKYKGHVVQIQVVVNNQGIPMDVQGFSPADESDLAEKHSVRGVSLVFHDIFQTFALSGSVPPAGAKAKARALFASIVS
eukprot:m51a1_g6564 hypothetical protein (95) ;mRNA; f:140567-147856